MTVKRALRWLGALFFLLVVLTASGLGWLVGTSSGLTWAVHMLEPYVPGLSVERIEGDITDMRAVNVVYEMPGVAVSAGGVRLAADLTALAQRRIVVAALELDGADVRVDTKSLPQGEAEADPVPADAPFVLALPDPWSASLQTLALNDIHVDVDGIVVELAELTASADWAGERVALAPVSAAGLRVTLPEPAPVAEEESLNRKIRWRRSAQGGEAVSLELADSKNLPALVDVPALRAMVQKPLIRQLPEMALPVSVETDAVSFKDFLLRQRTVEAPLLEVREAGWTSLRLDRSPARIEIEGLHADLPEAGVQGDLSWTLSDEWKGTADLRATVRETAFARLGLNRSELFLAMPAKKTEDADKTEKSVGSSSESAAGSESTASGAEPSSDPAAGQVRLGSADVGVRIMALGSLADKVELRTALTGGADAEFVVRAAPGEAGLPLTAELRLPLAAMLLPAQASAETASSGKPSKDDPAKKKPGYAAVRALHLYVDGRADDWKGRFTGFVHADLPGMLAKPVTIELKSSMGGSLEHFTLETLDAKLPEGALQMTMDARWGQRLDVTGNFRSDKLDLRNYLPEVRTALDGGFNVRASMRSDGAWRAALEDISLRADWKKAPVTLSGGAAVSSFGWAALTNLTATLGRNSVTLNGLLKGLQTVDLSADIKVPGIDYKLAGFGGRADGHINVRGPTLRPEIDADVRAEAIRWKNVSIGSVKIRGDVHPKTKVGIVRSKKTVADAVEAFEKLDAATQLERVIGASELNGTLRFLVENLRVTSESDAGTERALPSAQDGSVPKADASEPLEAVEPVEPLLNYKTIELATEGREGDHRVTLKVEGEPVALDMAWRGKLNRETMAWKGTFEKAVITTPAGDWTQEKPSGMTFEPETSTLIWEPSAWLHEHARVSLPETVRLGEKGRLKVVLEELRLDVFKPYLKRKERLSGRVRGEFKADWDVARGVVPNADWAFDADGLSYSTRVDGVRLPVTLEALRLTGSVRPEAVCIGWTVKPSGTGGVEGEAAVEDPMGARRMKGRVLVRDMTPVLLKPLLSKGERAEGVFSADLRVDGTLEAPRLWGELALKGVAVDAGFVPFEMEPSDLRVSFSGDRSNLEGVVRTAEGGIALTGDADWRDLTNWSARVRAAAQENSHVRITLAPMLDLDLVTDVTATADKTGVALSGRVDVPRARIVVTELPASTVDVSSDEVILDDKLQPVEKPAAPFPLRSRIGVGLGDDIRMDAFGLKAGLTGELAVVQDQRGLGLNGQIRIPDGRFHAYGQDLLVREGLIAFGGDPTNPSLTIEAIRNPDVTEDGVIVGVRVTGTANAPKVALFSEPAKPQQEMLSYLLRGEGLSSGSSDNDNSAMTAMLVGLGTATGGQVLGKIGDAIGIEGLGVDTTGVGDSAQVVVSGYILPGLQLKYGVGIFDSLATLTLRYRLMPKLYLEAASGVAQALDILYRFEFD